MRFRRVCWSQNRIVSCLRRHRVEQHAKRHKISPLLSTSPRKTIATAQNLYHRFHLFFSRKDFGYQVKAWFLQFRDNHHSFSLPIQDVTLAALYVSSKMHDTLKKPREILMASYTVRFPEQAAKSKSIVGEIDMDPAVRQGAHFKCKLLWTVKI